jgi:hypothetical protein
MPRKAKLHSATSKHSGVLGEFSPLESLSLFSLPHYVERWFQPTICWIILSNFYTPPGSVTQKGGCMACHGKMTKEEDSWSARWTWCLVRAACHRVFLTLSGRSASFLALQNLLTNSLPVSLFIDRFRWFKKGYILHWHSCSIHIVMGFS